MSSTTVHDALARRVYERAQLIESCRALRERGAIVVAVLCVIDREAGGAEALAPEGLTLRSLFTMSELRAAGA